MARSEFEQSLATMAHLVDIIPLALVIVDDNQLIRVVNSAATALLNLDEGRLRSNFNQVAQFVDDSQQNQQPLADFVDCRATNPFSLFIKQPNQSRPVIVLVKPISQNPGWHLVVIEDQTDDHQRNQSHNDFISTASHEMRTPLATIEGYLSLIANEKICQIDDQAASYVKQALDSTNHLSRLCSDLLASSQSHTGLLVNNPVKVNLAEFIEELIDTTNFAYQDKGLQLNLLVNDQPISRSTDTANFNLSADPDRLSELFSNLIENAVKYTDRGSITINLVRQESMVIVEIKDTGCGLAESDIEHIFKQFYRVDNQQLGTGLGLFIVSKIVDLYHGKIEVESHLGKGSTFRVFLPTA